MKTQFNTKTTTTIQLNDTFLRLVSGAASIGDVLAERATKRANEDASTRRRREWMERMDPFSANYCH